MWLVGLTGSIGMGKSTTAQMFREEGVAVHDSDAAVHEIYRGPQSGLIGQAFPGSVAGGVVDRAKLAAMTLGRPEEIARLESIVHPLVQHMRRAFLEAERRRGAKIAVVDIPLLYETGAEKEVDKIVVVSAAPEVQRERVMARPGMTEEKFRAILARQLPDSEKRKRADFVVHTDRGMEAAREDVRAIVAALAEEED
ncbi:dephospho-CoA kinase [Methylocystis bryophila]|uniref:Dephospho-CoA kinase n=1 Tax=Methylocystis bryophila TaxID=655015 RepID=A0A1W6MUP8_9HYPH|nr:dephospho-CoA kinase [Methylocystis bryophila]ARN81331.1 dephospho-CoA kinase [Methylocystis bryophila]BDV37313.1 dephospho-CoA kinase [Methylocystis bryophila]